MKKLKKSISLVLAMMMFVAMACPLFANELGTITIQNNTETTGVSMVGHTYSVFKIFDVTVKQVPQSSGIDLNKYAYSVDEKFKEFFKERAAYEGEDVTTSQKLNEYAVAYVQSYDGKMDILTKELRNYIRTKKVTPEKTSEEAAEEKVVINGVPLGYYMILDNGIDGNDDQVIAAAALGTTGNKLTVNLKGSAPTIDKEIQHNESAGPNGNEGWGNVGDNQIGDIVNYRFISTVPSNLTGYETYVYTITDTMSKGLTFNNDIKIYKDKDKTQELSTDFYKVNIPGKKTGSTFDIEINILYAIKEGALKPGDTLYTYYTATLNEDAFIAGEPNTNKVDLEYSNDPYDNESTTTTPEVEVKDYTFKINGLKTAENIDGDALEGAEFELSTGNKAIYFKKTTKDDGTNVYLVCTNSDHSAEGPSCTTQIISGTNGRFEIIGLDDAVEYTLTETKAPDGYNPIDPIKFTIEATYDGSGNIIGIKTNVEGITQVDGFELGTTIVNKSGDKLPETGGIGTTLFKVIGSILMIGSAVLLITKRRLGRQQK